jgi:hypothetical protein
MIKYGAMDYDLAKIWIDGAGVAVAVFGGLRALVAYRKKVAQDRFQMLMKMQESFFSNRGFRPRWSPQNRPMVVTPKPANESVARTSHSFTLPGPFQQGGSCTRRKAAGDSQGGRSPSCGGSRRMGRASAFCWRGTCRGVGGTRPPRLSPEGKRERGDQIPCAAG